MGAARPLDVAYHDDEWGLPVDDDRTLFEFLILESAQAGLSWYTILQRRDGYRRGFAAFAAEQVAGFGADHVESLLQDPGIIRHRGKIEAAIHNAQRFLEVQAEFGSFGRYARGFVEGAPRQNAWRTHSEIPARTDESDRFARDLKRCGFKFLGSTTIYAWMQATGLVNDHLVSCFRHSEVAPLL